MMVMEMTVNVKVGKGMLKEISFRGFLYTDGEELGVLYLLVWFGKKAKYYKCK